MPRSSTFTRVLLAGGFTCAASWLALAVTAGNVALQRSVSVGPVTFLERPETLAIPGAAAFAAAQLAARALGTRPFPTALAVLVGDAFAAIVLAPVLVGELELVHAPAVFAAVAAFGLQPFAAFVGARVGSSMATEAGS